MDESTPKRLIGRAGSEGLSSWCWAVELAEADGPALHDPWALPDFRRDKDNPLVNELGGTPLSTSIRNGGRIFITESHKGRLEVWPLFDRPGASGTIQIFGFDWWTKERIHFEAAGADRSMIASPDKTTIQLGIPYSLTRDLDQAPRVLDVSCEDDAEIVTLSRSNTGLPWVDRINGTTMYAGSRHVFNTAGFGFYFPWVVSVSGEAEPGDDTDKMALLMRSI